MEDLLSPEIWPDPYPYLAGLREDDPVHWSPWWNGWVITRYDDTEALLKRRHVLSAATAAAARSRAGGSELETRDATFRMLGSWLVLIDPPDHTRIRRLVNKAFTPVTVERLRSSITAAAGALLDGFGPGDRIDLIADFSRPLTLSVISDMLGIPPDDRLDLSRWSGEIQPLVLDGRHTPGRRDTAEATMREMAAYFAAAVAERRRHPGDDLVSDLVRAEDDGGILTEDEVVATAILLIFAGQGTTTALLGSAVVNLGRNPEQRDLLLRAPQVMPLAVEEFLRYSGPAFAATRVAREDFSLRGREISTGDKLLLVLGAANRDPEQFPEPDRLLLDRDPNPHLALGSGVHHCLGAALARLETQVGLGHLLGRFPGLSLVPGAETTWQPMILTREPECVPVSLGPAVRPP